MVELKSPCKENFVKQHLLLDRTTWTGLKDVVGDDKMSSHRWSHSNVSLVETGYSNWEILSPDFFIQECVALVKEATGEWKWYDRQCWQQYHFICEKGK